MGRDCPAVEKTGISAEMAPPVVKAVKPQEEDTEGDEENGLFSLGEAVPRPHRCGVQVDPAPMLYSAVRPPGEFVPFFPPAEEYHDRPDRNTGNIPRKVRERQTERGNRGGNETDAEDQNHPEPVKDRADEEKQVGEDPMENRRQKMKQSHQPLENHCQNMEQKMHRASLSPR